MSFSYKQAMDGVGNGYNTAGIMSEFARKDEVPTKEEFDNLTDVVASKLDANPAHTHEISQIKELQNTLNTKLSSDKKYNYSSILSNPEAIDYIKSLETLGLKLVPSKTADGYEFEVNSVGDLRIIYKDDVIMNYDAVNRKWLIDDIDIKQVLQNHTEALKTLLPDGTN